MDIVLYYGIVRLALPIQATCKNSFNDTLCVKFAITRSLKSYHTITVSLYTLPNVPVKEFLKSVSIWRRYGQKFGW